MKLPGLIFKRVNELKMPKIPGKFQDYCKSAKY